MSTPLETYPIDHAGRRAIMHPDLKREIATQTAVRYLRFLRPVLIDHPRWSSSSALSGMSRCSKARRGGCFGTCEPGSPVWLRFLPNKRDETDSSRYPRL